MSKTLRRLQRQQEFAEAALAGVVISYVGSGYIITHVPPPFRAPTRVVFGYRHQAVTYALAALRGKVKDDEHPKGSAYRNITAAEIDQLAAQAYRSAPFHSWGPDTFHSGPLAAVQHGGDQQRATAGDAVSDDPSDGRTEWVSSHD